ncbi:MAG: UvrB/UvrC motif-containing protein [Gemmatimonadaceae bacterium]
MTPRRTAASDAHLATLRGEVRAAADDRPGIYRMLSSDGEVLYIGKSKRVRTRLMSYFRCAYPEEKGARILRDAHSIDWEYTPSEFAALLRELELIKQLRPRFNVQMKRDDRHYVFIKVTRGAAPKLLVVRGAGSEPATYYGPFLGARRVNEAVHELSDALSLRDCSQDRGMVFADQQELFQLAPRTPGCIRLEVKKCLGPCVAACTANEYLAQVDLARAFLDGTDDGPIARLRTEMDACAEQLNFERAAVLRDKFQRLESLREMFARMRFAVETLSFTYAVPGHDGDDRVYIIRRGTVRAETRAPRRARDRARLLGMVRDVFDPPERATTAVPTHEIDELLLLSSWFRRHPAELERTTAPRVFLGREPATATALSA